jgi:hypothetical protein
VSSQEIIEPPEFQGLLYCDGLDALGRPVVVVNADAVAEERSARKAAFQYLLYQLEPIVVQVLPSAIEASGTDWQRWHLYAELTSGPLLRGNMPHEV